jgi:hypothetical protein
MIDGLNLSMMAIVDYRGFRLIAQSLVPIEGTRTLVFGSSDAGNTMYPRSIRKLVYFNDMRKIKELLRW